MSALHDGPVRRLHRDAAPLAGDVRALRSPGFRSQVGSVAYCQCRCVLCCGLLYGCDAPDTTYRPGSDGLHGPLRGLRSERCELEDGHPGAQGTHRGQHLSGPAVRGPTHGAGAESRAPRGRPRGPSTTIESAPGPWITAEQPSFGIMSLAAYLGLRDEFGLRDRQGRGGAVGGQQYFLVSSSASSSSSARGSRSSRTTLTTRDSWRTWCPEGTSSSRTFNAWTPGDRCRR